MNSLRPIDARRRSSSAVGRPLGTKSERTLKSSNKRSVRACSRNGSVTPAESAVGASSRSVGRRSQIEISQAEGISGSATEDFREAKRDTAREASLSALPMGATIREQSHSNEGVAAAKWAN